MVIMPWLLWQHFQRRKCTYCGGDIEDSFTIPGILAAVFLFPIGGSWSRSEHKITVYDDGAWPDCQRRWWWIVTLRWSSSYGNVTSPRILDISTQGSPCVVASKNASVFFAQEPACDETLFDEHRKRNKQSNKNGQNIFCTLGCWCMWGWFKKLDVSWSSQTRKKHWRRPKQTRCNILDYNLLSV